LCGGRKNKTKRLYTKLNTKQKRSIAYNVLQIGGRFNAANMLLAAVFLSLIISNLENKLKISLKKFAQSK